MPFYVFRRDHLRFGIICRPVWGSFAALYSSKFSSNQPRSQGVYPDLAKSGKTPWERGWLVNRISQAKYLGRFRLKVEKIWQTREMLPFKLNYQVLKVGVLLKILLSLVWIQIYFMEQQNIIMQRTANQNAACLCRICKRSDQPKIERLVNSDARLILRRKLNGATTRQSSN